MSSGFKLSDRQSIGLSSNDGAHILQFRSPAHHTRYAQAESTTTQSHDTSPRVTFSSLTLDELSKELDRRTKETQRLQDEVDNATKLTLERFGTYGIPSSPGLSCHNQKFNDYYSPGDSTTPLIHLKATTQPLVRDLDSLNKEVAQTDISSLEEKLFENTIDDCLQQQSASNITETHDQPKPAIFSFEKTIKNLPTELHKVQMDKDIVSDLRLKDSRIHVGRMEKMLSMLEEVQNIKRVADQKLQVTKDHTAALNRRVETLEQNVKEMYSSLLSQEKQCGDNAVTSPDDAISSRRVLPLNKLTEEFNNETDGLQPLMSVEHLGREEDNGVNEQKERIRDLIASLGQEMALLTDNLGLSMSNSVSLSFKLQMLNKLVEKQTSLHQCQVNKLVSALSRHKDKVHCLEQQLAQAQLQIVDAQREKEKSLQKEETLQSMLGKLKSCHEQQQCEVQEEIKALRGRLEVVGEHLHQAGEEKICQQVLLEKRTLEGRKYQELLEEKNNKSHLRHQQHLARLEEAERWSHTLQADRETLRLKLVDQEKMMDILRLQMENSTQMTLQLSHTIDNLQHENSLLGNQLNHLKMENQQLRADLNQNSEDILEKQQVTTQLDFQRMELLNLKKKHQQLQQLLSFKNGEHEGVVLNLQGQLRNTHDELDQVRRTLRTLKRADGHGLQAAVDMQEQITTRREHIDSLQSRIQHLEEMIEKLHKEKLYHSLEYQCQLQELTVIKEEKRQLGSELEAHLSKDKQLRDQISQLEAILHKMSESIADCQDFHQLQEQNLIRLKIQHALDLKELQGQTMHTALKGPPPHLAPMSSSALNAPPSSQHASDTQITPNSQQESPARQPMSLVKELRAVISENHRPHMDSKASVSSFHRRSAPERMHRITLSPEKAEEVKGDTRCRRKICTSHSHVLKTVDLNGKITNKSFSESPDKLSSAFALRYTSSPHLLSLGQRSPVHSLLTSNPDSKQ